MAKAKIHTTFAAAHAVGACVEAYKKMAKALGGIENYGRDKPFTLTQVLNVLGLDDALWVLDECAMGADAHRIKHEYRADCAARVLKVFEKERPTDSRPRDAIKASRDYGADRIDDTAMAAAMAAAWDARVAARVDTMTAAMAAAGDAASQGRRHGRRQGRRRGRRGRRGRRRGRRHGRRHGRRLGRRQGRHLDRRRGRQGRPQGRSHGRRKYRTQLAEKETARLSRRHR